MGQYYIVVFLAEKGLTKAELLRAWLLPPYGSLKLMEHSYLNNIFVAAIEKLISPEGKLYKSRVVWAGDYADPEPDFGSNLHCMAGEDKKIQLESGDTEYYRYIVNHTKKQYVDKKKHVFDKWWMNIHPLPLLTAEGNGRGGGDYKGSCQELVGTWARDVISVERLIPDGYVELVCEFAEL